MKLDENDVDKPAAKSDNPKEKLSLAPVALLAFLLAPIVALGTFFSGAQTTTEFTIDQESQIRVFVLIKATEFLRYSEKNVCDGSGQIAGLWRSEIQISASTWVRKVQLGQGTLNADGACEYRLKVTPPYDFDGGDVIASAILPIGKAEDLVLDSGTKPSFKQIDLTYNLG
jgi:hypothetical protein